MCLVRGVSLHLGKIVILILFVISVTLLSFTPIMERFIMFHTLAWFENIAQDAAADIQPVVDDIITIQNNHFLPQRDKDLLWAAFLSADSVTARIITPSLRQITTPYIRPVNPTLLPGNQPNVADYRANPLRLRGLEELQIEAEQTAVGAADVYIVAGVQDSAMIPMPAGDVYSLRGVGTTTVVADAWSTVAITWQDTLPSGNFAVVGLEVFSTTGIAGRLIFEDQVLRPGCIGGLTEEDATHEMFRKGGLGVWGRFQSNRMPIPQFLCTAADTAQIVYLDIIRVG